MVGIMMPPVRKKGSVRQKDSTEREKRAKLLSISAAIAGATLSSPAPPAQYEVKMGCCMVKSKVD
jgi:hypothetical protein